MNEFEKQVQALESALISKRDKLVRKKTPPRMSVFRNQRKNTYLCLNYYIKT